MQLPKSPSLLLFLYARDRCLCAIFGITLGSARLAVMRDASLKLAGSPWCFPGYAVAHWAGALTYFPVSCRIDLANL